MVGPRKVALALGLIASIATTATTIAAPSPDNTKNALLIEVDCGGTSFVGASIFQNASIALHIQGDDGTVAKIVSLWSYTNEARTDGEELWFTTPGFDHNGAEAVTCEWWNALYPGLYWRGDLVVRPAG
jgi:hypothetical protein